MMINKAEPKPYRCKRHGLTGDYRINKSGSRTCRTCARDLARLRNQANPACSRDRTRRWRAAHPEQSRESSRQSVAKWREANPEQAAAAVKAAYQKDIGAKLRSIEKRRRLLEGVVNDLTTEQWEMLKRLCDYRCGHCGEKLPLTRDHIIPLSKGGANTLANIIPSCRPCNSSKGSSLDWLPRVA